MTNVARYVFELREQRCGESCCGYLLLDGDTHIPHHPCAHPQVKKLIINPDGFEPLQGNFNNVGRAVAYLQGMEELDLSGNAFSGKMPAQWADPENLQSIKIIRLKGNQIEDTLKKEWSTKGVFFYLNVLDLSDNKFSGPLPTSWGQDGFPQLNKLILAGNQLTGSLPLDWGTEGWWPAFNVLDVSRNQISGRETCCIMGVMCCVSVPFQCSNSPHHILSTPPP